MRQNRLGRTGLSVTEIGLGGLFVSSHGNEGDRAKAYAAIRQAVRDCGVNYVDTAPGYADSEEVLGKVLPELERERGGPLILSTKLGGRPQPFDPKDKAALRRSVEESLRLLGRDRIDVLMVHEPDRPRQYDWWDSGVYAETISGPVLETLAELKAEGVIGFMGMGGTTVTELTRLCETGIFDVVLTAFNFSLLWREAENTVIPAAKRQNMGIVIGSPLQQGALAHRYDAEITDGAPWLSEPRRAQFKALYALVDEAAMPLPEMGIRFVLSHPDIHTTLIGARSAAEVAQNVAAAEKGPLPADLLTRIGEIAVMVPFRPFCEPFGLPFGHSGYRGPGIA